MNRRRNMALAAMVLLAAAQAVAQTGEKIELRFRCAPGERWQNRSRFDMQMQMQINAGAESQQLQQKVEDQKSGSVEIVAVENGLPSVVRVLIDAGAKTVMEQNGQRSEMVSPLAGKQAVVKRDAMGIVTIDTDVTLDDETTKMLQKVVDPEKSFYPAGPVGVGDKWDANPQAVAKEFGLGPKDRGSMQCELKGLTQHNGRKAAHVGVVVSAEKTEEGFILIKTEMRGDALLDVQTGQVLKLDLRGEMGATGAQQVQDASGQPVQVNVTGRGGMSVSMSSELVAGGTPAPAPVVDNNRISDGPPASPFAGTFKNERMTVMLKPAAGQCTGEVKLGESAFPLTAKEESGTLTGTFTNGADSYGFTATVSGDTLSFVTDGVTHTLKRAGGNPLNERRNPLNPGVSEESNNGSPTHAPPDQGGGAPPASATDAPEHRQARGPATQFQPMNGESRLLVGTTNDATGPGALDSALNGLAGVFDGRPQLVGAVSSQRSPDMQALFVARRGGAPVRGMVLCGTRTGGKTVVVWDAADQFASSAPNLLNAAGGAIGGGGSPIAQAVPLVPQMLPDGSGQIKLPQDWRVTSAANGAVDAMGPDGAAVALGAAFPILTPEGAAAMWNGAAGALVAPFCGPADALPIVQSRLNEWAQTRARETGTAPGPLFLNIRIIESQPLPWANEYLGATAQAAMVLWDCDVQHAGQPPQPYRNISLISTSPINESQWMYYTSHALSPAARFAGNYPTLVSIWSNWRVSDLLLQERMRKAADTMREITRIRQESHANTQNTYDNTNRAWSHVIRGDWPVEDVRDGRRATIDNNVINTVVNLLNEADGPNNWVIVPLNELNR